MLCCEDSWDIVFSVECIEAPPGGEGWPRNSKNENLSASQSANCNISHLVKAAAPLTCYPATQYFTQLEKLSIYIGRNPRNAQVDKWTKILLIGNHCQEFRVLTLVTATTPLSFLDVIGTVVISSIYVALGQV